MQFKRILSGFMSFTMALSAVSMPVFGAAYINSSRTKWAGYDNNVRPADFDTWDGSSWDISWYDEAEGTKDDPYIIDSAADLVGLTHLTASTGNHTDNLLTNTVYNVTNDASLFSNKEHYAILRNDVNRNFEAWYKYTMPKLNVEFVRFDCIPVEYTVRYVLPSGTEKSESAWYADDIKLVLNINGKEQSFNVTETMRDYAEIYAKNTNETTQGYYRCVAGIVPFDTNTIYPIELIGFENSYTHEYHTEFPDKDSVSSWFDYKISKVNLMANISDGLLVVQFKGNDGYGNLKADVKHIIGLLSDLGLPIFPTVVATNSVGKSITINENNYGDFYLPENLTPSKVTPTTIDLYDNIGFNSDYYNGTYNQKSVSINKSITTNSSGTFITGLMQVKHPYAYFKQNSETETELKYMPNAVLSTYSSLIKYKVVWNYDATNKVVNFDAIKYTSSNTELGDHIIYSVDLEPTLTSNPTYDKLSSLDFIYSYDPISDSFSLHSNIIIRAKVDSYSYSSKYIYGETVIDNQVIDPLDIKENLTILSSGEPIDISECTLLGFSNISPSEAQQIIARNCYVRNRQAIYAETSVEDPTFTNKYIRLDKDIDISIIPTDYLFPIQESNELAGLNCDFDMNNHIIRTKSSLFGTIYKNGYLHDGIIVATGFDAKIASNQQAPIAIINENFGIVDNIQFMPNSIFEYNLDISSSVILVMNNIGQLRNCTGYVGQYDSVILTNNNSNIIKDTTLMLITEPYTTQLGGMTVSFIKSNQGIIDGFLFDSDKDIAWDEGKIGHVSMYIIESNNGYISNMTLSNFKIANSCAFSAISNNAGTIDNLQSDFSIVNYAAMSMPQISLIAMGDSYYYNNYILNGTIKNSRINYNGTLQECPLIFGETKSSIIDCNININITTINKNNYWHTNTFMRSDIYNSKINLNGMQQLFDKDSRTRDSIRYVFGNIYNSEITADYLTVYRCDSYVAEKAYNTKFNIKHLKFFDVLFGTLEDCVIIAEKASGTHTEGYENFGLTNKARNTDVIIKAFTGVFSNFCGASRMDNNTKDAFFENNRCSITFKDEFYITGSDWSGSNNDFVNNCEFYYYFDESAKGTMYSLGSRGYSDKEAYTAATNCLIYIDKMPNTVTLEGASLLSAVAGRPSSIHGITKFDKGAGLTVIAPHLNVIVNNKSGNYSSDIRGFAIVEGVQGDLTNVHDTYIDANIYIKNLSDISFVTAFNSYTNYSNPDIVMTNNVWNINVFDENGNIADIPVYGLASTTYPNNFKELKMNATMLTSNSLSTKSAIIETHAAWNLTQLLEGKQNIILRNCVLNLPNTPDYIPGVTNFGEYPGLIRLTDIYEEDENNCISYSALSGILQRLGLIGIMHCYVPENKSWAPSSFNENPALDMNDIINTLYTETITNESTQLERNVNAIVAKYGKDITISDDAASQGVKFFKPNGNTSGELAYLLDNGGTARRSYHWSVATEDDYIKDSFTNEKIYEFPHSTVLSTLWIPDRCLGENSNLKPVFKTTMKAAEGGYVELEGIGDTHTNHDADDVVYVKQGQQIVSDIQSNDESVILVYATQQLGTAYPARIPNTPAETARAVEDAYTIKGYKQQSIDTIITPVFKTGYNIIVDITGSEHGTIVPSAYISAEGEKITVNQDVENGYTITNLKVNGEPLTSDSFFMPAEEVSITGDCVPFEGGILSFKLFGFDGEIDQINKTINVTVPRTSYITNALPEIEYVGDYISPSENSRVDFTNPVEYTVTYGEGQTITYTVTVEVGEYTMRIYDFIVDGIHGEINQARRTINVKMPSGTDLQHITPESIIYSAESILANEHEERNFLTPQVYTLYATGMTPVSYVVTMTTADDDEAEITQFKVSGYEGVIDQDNSVITLNVPNGIDFTDIMPDIIKYTGKKLEINKASKNDLSNRTYYTVTSQNDIDRQYEVVANYISDNEAHIDTFTLAGINGEIDQTTKTITLTVPSGTILTDVKPDELTYTAKSIYPRIDTLQDFTAPVKYTVIAPDNTEVTYTVKVETKKSSEALLYEFDILGFRGEVNQEDKTVTVKFPFGIDISNTPPSNVVISEGAIINPTENEIQDFRKPIDYIVTAEDGETTNKYTVNCIVDVPSKEAIITHFEILDTPGEIDQDEKEITITLPSDTTPDDLKDVVPEITWSGETLNPNEDTPQDFNNPPDYTVTAKDPTVVVTYDIIVKVLPKEPTPQPEPPKELDKTAIITHFEILDTPGDIDEDEKTITIELPSDTKPEDLEDIKPTIKWKGEDITPDDDKPQDFNNPPDYTVTAEDPTIKNTYEIIVKIKEPEVIITPSDPDKTAIITHFELLDTPGVIDQENHTITIRLPWDTKPEYLVDAIPMIVWEGKTINPGEDEPNNFNTTLTYTVTAEDPEINVAYTVITTILDKPYDVNPNTGVSNSSALIGFTAFCAVLAVATSRKNKLLNND